MDSYFYAVSSLSDFYADISLTDNVISWLLSFGDGFYKPVPPFICILVFVLACFLVRKIAMAIRR